MSSAGESQTISRALLNLGRISSVEGPIRSGFVALYKAQRLGSAESEIPEDVRYHMARFQEFCERFAIISELEDRRDKLEKWLSKKPKKEQEIASRTETYVGILSLFSEKKERQDWVPTIRSLCEKTRHILDRSATPEDIQSSLRLLEKLQKMVEDRLTSDKRASEKILSGRAPLR